MKIITQQTIKLFWQHMRRYRWQFGLIISSIIIAAILEVVTPLYYKRFFDLLTVTSKPLAELTSGLIDILFIIVGINILMWLMYRLASFTNNFFQPRVMADLTNTCFEYLHRHSFGFFSNRFVGALVKRVGRLVAAFEDITDMVYWDILRMVVRLSFILIILFLNYSLLGFILLAWLVVYLVINYLLSLKQLALSEAAAEADSAVSGYLADTVMNQSTVKLFTSFGYERRGFGALTLERFRRDRRSWNFDATIEAIQVAFMIALEFAVFYLAVRFWQRGLLTVGDFVLIQVYVIRVFDHLWGVGRIIRRLYRRFGDAAEMVEIINEPHQVQDKPGAKRLAVRRGELEFKNVSFTYLDSPQVIHNFNLKIKAGEKVGLVGPSGAGKSTLAALLLRFYDLTSGTVLIDGQNIAEVTQESLRGQISFVPQDPVLFHRSLKENIRYGRRQATDEEVVAAAKLAHCDQFIERLSQGYDTYVGERGLKLSGGERQRVAIARAILKNAPILVLDEATSSLDSQTEALIQDALTNLMRGKTTLVIAHRLSTIMKMDRIVVVRAGTIQEIGSHEELLKQGRGLYQKLWELQAGGFLRP